MAKKPDSYLIVEAKRLGFKHMLKDIDKQLQDDLSAPLVVALTDQQQKIEEMLKEL